MSAKPAPKKNRGTKGPTLRIAMVSPEIAPFAKTGGLADVAGGLSRALEHSGIQLSLVMPAYRSVMRGGFSPAESGPLSVPISGREETATFLKTTLGKTIDVYLIRCDRYFDRDYFYTTPEGDYPDNAERFTFFSRAALEVLRSVQPGIIHAHDWQSALALVFLKAQPENYPELSSAKGVFTVHNLGYQGLFWHSDWHLLNLDEKFFTPRYLEFYGKINFLKGGVVFADKITTVSPTYAQEIQTPEQGFGLDGVFRERARDLVGILNGADYEVWNPETDPLIARNYRPRDPSGKKECKAALQQKLGLPNAPQVPLLGMISRLTSQKGLDLIAPALDEILGRDVQLAFLGSGEKNYEDLFRNAAERYREKAAIRIGFDETLAHQIEAGADIFLMPSLYEPCGLNQIYSLKYGTIPIVRGTGGLKDTVEDVDAPGKKGNGFVFVPYEPPALVQTLDRALGLFSQKKKWAALVKRAMSADYSWGRSAREYERLYREIAAGR